MVSGSQTNIVDEIKSRCNIVDVIGRVVSLKKAGSNYKGLCPFHNEKTPSFVVSETKQIFKCFGCGESGDVISFVEKYYNLDFKGAAEMLAREYGIDISGSFTDQGNKKELYNINREAAIFFFKSLRAGDNPGLAYMKKRGLSRETLRVFGIGYADENWTSLTDYLTGKGFDHKTLLDLGLVSRSDKGRYYDKFRGRVIFPIINTAGDIIGFGGRIIGEGEPKYLNSQETRIFQKKNNLYGLNLAKNYVNKEDSIILVEGYMDVVSLYQAGIKNVSASLGTALTSNQASLIKRFTRNVVLSYDADNAGQNAADRGLDILYDEGLKASVLKVPEGKDPDEFVKKNGRRAFAQLIADAVPAGDFKINRIKSKYDLSKDQERSACIEEMVQMLAGLKPVDADIYAAKIADDLGVSEAAVKRQLDGIKDGNAQRSQRYRRSEADQPVKDTISQVEKTLLKLIIIDRQYGTFPEGLEEHIFTSAAGAGMYKAVMQIEDKEHTLSADMLSSSIDPEYLGQLDEVMEVVVPAGKERQTYDECMRFIRTVELQRKADDISNQLEMGEGILSDEDSDRLIKELVDIQKKIIG
ncbi:MAG: DNA primase [Bacillota bacterium]|nr:DNA primase [Bacillota bacterium]